MILMAIPHIMGQEAQLCHMCLPEKGTAPSGDLYSFENFPVYLKYINYTFLIKDAEIDLDKLTPTASLCYRRQSLCFGSWKNYLHEYKTFWVTWRSIVFTIRHTLYVGNSDISHRKDFQNSSLKIKFLQ